MGGCLKGPSAAPLMQLDLLGSKKSALAPGTGADSVPSAACAPAVLLLMFTKQPTV